MIAKSGRRSPVIAGVYMADQGDPSDQQQASVQYRRSAAKQRIIVARNHGNACVGETAQV